MSKPIAGMYGVTDNLVQLVTGDIDDQVARRRARGDEGSSIAWIVGHMLQYRHQAMAALGSPQPNPFDGRFGNSADDGAGYPTVAELRNQWAATARHLSDALDRVTDEQLLTVNPQGPHGEQSTLDLMSFFQWHEAYHMGALGMLRTQMGLKPTSTLAMEAAGHEA